jgi:type IV pilus assembly protein PilZ
MLQPANSSTGAASRPSIIQLSIKEKAALYAAYMPYLKNGGVFVPTTKEYKIGDDVYVILALMDDPNKLPIAGKVAWISPRGSAGGRTQGIGVHFPSDDSGNSARRRIEEILGAALGSSRQTHTL